MELHFLGGADEVGRSAILMKGEHNILLDYGVKLDGKTEYPLMPCRLDAFVLSHAHLDHSGFAPFLYDNYLPPAFGTAPTTELSKLLIEDSIKIGRKRKQKPKFSKNDLRKFEKAYVPYSYETEIDAIGYVITLHDAGHITGSAQVEVECSRTGKKLVYTGDFKLEPQILQGGAEILDSDILVIESTYADREHPDRGTLIRSFVDDVKAVVDNGGTALVPSFAVGRAQEIIAILYKNGLIDCTSIDGMAQKATEIVMHYPDFSKNEHLLLSAMKNANWVGVEKNRRDTLSEPGIIVTTAGMLNGGPVLDYITALNNKSKVFITGYQVEGTNGRKLQDGKPIIIDGKQYSVKNPVASYDFSAHAGKKDLFEYVRKSKPETVVCVHGESQVARAFAESLKIEGFNAHAPRMGEAIQLEF